MHHQISSIDILRAKWNKKVGLGEGPEKHWIRPIQKKAFGGIGFTKSFLDVSEFSAPITNSLILDRGVGSPNFVRATEAKVQNNDGYMVTALSGEARFTRARRIYNLIPAAGTGSASLAVAANKSMTLAAGTYVFSMGAGTGTATFSGTGGASGTLAATALGRVSVSKTISAGTLVVTASVATLVDLQVEWVDPQTTKTAGEYVSVGALDYRTDKDPLFVNLTGAAGTYVSTPDSVANSITGDIDIRVRVALTDWTPAAHTGLVGKSDSVATISYSLILIATSGILMFRCSSNGSTILDATSSVSTGFVDGFVGHIRVTRIESTGDVTFYTSNDGISWTQLGSVRSTAAGSLFDSNSSVVVGGNIYHGYGCSGSIYSAQIYNGIGGTLAVDYNAHRDAVTPTGTITSSTTGEVWTNNGAATVRSAPYHGAGVDGVKYFNTDISGNPIPAATLKGYLPEGGRTDICPQSNAFTTTWVASGTPSATQNVTGPDGVANSAWTLTDNDGGATEFITLNVTLTAADYTYSLFVKKTTGAQASYPVLYYYVGGGTQMAACTIDTSNGVATNWTAFTSNTMASGTAASCESYNTDFWRVSLKKTGTAAVNIVTIVPAGTTNATQSTGAIDVAAQGSAVIFGAQVELGSFASSYIPTTTIPVARNADVLSYTDAANFSQTEGWLYCEASSYGFSNADHLVAISDGTTNERITLRNSSSDDVLLVVDGGVSQAAVSIGVPTLNVTYKRAGSYAANKFNAARNGVAGVEDVAGTLPTTTQINIGSIAGTNPMFGNIKNVRIGKRQLSAAQLAAITA